MTRAQDLALRRVNRAFDNYANAQQAFNALARQYMWNRSRATFRAMQMAMEKENKLHAIYIHESEKLAAAWETCAAVM